MIKDYALGLPDVLIVLAVILFWVVALWRTLNVITPFDDHKELGRNNVAFAVQRSSLAAAQVIGLLATVDGYDHGDRFWSFVWMMAEGLWVFLAILLSRYVVDWIVLPGIKNVELLLQKNAAIAAVEAGSYLGLGFILAGSLTGGAESEWLSLASTVVFFALGLAFVLGIFWLHELVTPYNLRDRLKEGRLTAGLEIGSLILAMSIVVSVGVAGDFTGWIEGFKAFALTSVISVVLLYPLWMLLNRFGPGQSEKAIQEKDCLAAVVVTSGFLVLMGLCVSATVSTVL